VQKRENEDCKKPDMDHKAREVEQADRDAKKPGTPRYQRKGKKDWWLQEQWEMRWEQERKRKEQAQPGQEIPAAWNTPRREGGLRLHKGWTRPQSTMATLIRTEHIG